MYFPKLLPDEHVYSGFIRARYLNAQMYINTRRFFEINELPYHLMRSQVPLCSNLRAVIDQIGNSVQERFQLRLYHTPFAPWLLSLPIDKRPEALVNSGLRNNVEESNFVTDRRWKFCPECMLKERQDLGVAYWHSSHQMLGARMCNVHQSPLSSHDELRYLDFTLPHHWADRVSPLSVSLWQSEWQTFIDAITKQIQNDVDWSVQLPIAIKRHLGLPYAKVKQRDRKLFNKLYQRMLQDLGNDCLAGLFASIARRHANAPNLLWATLSGRSMTKGLRHPLYWLAILFWLKDELPELRVLNENCFVTTE